MARTPKRRINLRFDPDVLAAVDEAARRRGLDRTAYMELVCAKEIIRDGPRDLVSDELDRVIYKHVMASDPPTAALSSRPQAIGGANAAV
jgi:uncharacterized protein (DUF1778 family)